MFSRKIPQIFPFSLIDALSVSSAKCEVSLASVVSSETDHRRSEMNAVDVTL